MSLERAIVRTYSLPIREVREAVLQYLKAKSMPVPMYVGDTPDCKWSSTPDGGVKVEWSETDEI